MFNEQYAGAVQSVQCLVSSGEEGEPSGNRQTDCNTLHYMFKGAWKEQAKKLKKHGVKTQFRVSKVTQYL